MNENLSSSQFPVGAEVRVSGNQLSQPGMKNVPYGYIAKVTGTHEPTGRLQVESVVRGKQVVRHDEDVRLASDPLPKPKRAPRKK